MQIDNSYFVQQCPMCGSSNIINTGDIKYADSLFFADTKVDLLRQPQLWKCRTCNSRFTQNAILENDANNLYIQKSNNRWKHSDSFENFHTTKIVNMIRNLCRPGMQVLDIGCSSGYLLDYAKNLGCNTYGIEFSDSGRTDCIKKGHFCFKNIQEFPQNILFDGIFCFDVIEHVYSINLFFDQFSQFLKPGGFFCIITGNIQGCISRKYGSNWWYVRYPEHIRFPSVKFFSMLNNYKILDKKFCYASKYHESKVLRKIFKLIKRVFEGDFDGNPSLIPDHICVVLEKNVI